MCSGSDDADDDTARESATAANRTSSTASSEAANAGSIPFASDEADAARPTKRGRGRPVGSRGGRGGRASGGGGVNTSSRGRGRARGRGKRGAETELPISAMVDDGTADSPCETTKLAGSDAPNIESCDHTAEAGSQVTTLCHSHNCTFHAVWSGSVQTRFRAHRGELFGSIKPRQD